MIRSTFTAQVSRDPRYRIGGLKSGRLAIEVHGSKGFSTRAADVLKNLPAMLALKGIEIKFYTLHGLELNAAALVGKTAEEIDAMAAEIDTLSQAADARQLQEEIPEMIPFSDNVDIMAKTITVGLFKQVMQGYRIFGPNADKLRSTLDDPSRAVERLECASLLDAREFAKRLSDLTGRKFRVPTEAERRAILNSFDQIWSETKKEIVRHGWSGEEIHCYPDQRGYRLHIRLVEDR